MSIVFVILIVLLVCWPWISRFVTRMVSQFMARRAEDMMRRMMGMPSRKEERRKRRSRESAHKHGDGGENFYSDGSADAGKRRHRRPAYSVAALLRSVAVDVEYVEIREFSPPFMDDGSRFKLVYEEQVSDVEYTEIRNSR